MKCSINFQEHNGGLMALFFLDLLGTTLLDCLVP
jgi:hypothetical protein